VATFEELKLSRRNGQHFSPFEIFPIGHETSLNSVAVREDRLYVGTSSGLYVGTLPQSDRDDLQPLQRVSEIEYEPIRSIVVDGRHCWIDLSQDDLGSSLYFSHDFGRQFEPTYLQEVDFPKSISTTLTHGNLLFAGSLNGLFVSNNSGQSFQRLGEDDLGADRVLSLAVEGNTLFVGTRNGLGISQDLGQGFQTFRRVLRDGNQTVLSILPMGDQLFVGTTSGLLFSHDRGVGFHEFDTLFGARETGMDNSIRVLAIKHMGQRLVLGTDRGLFYVDEMSSGRPRFRAALLDELVTSIVSQDNHEFIGTRSQGVIHRLNGREINQALDSIPSSIEALAIRNEQLFVGTFEGLAISHDYGQTIHYSDRQDGLPDRRVLSLSLSPDGENLFIGTPQGLVIQPNLSGSLTTGELLQR
jgi:ligand-binding sensor domain-containing protein